MSTPIPSFCQVLDNRLHPIGITTQMSPHSLCLSLPKSFSSYSLFAVTLKRVDVAPALTVRLVVSMQKSQARSDEYDDITVNIENPESFQDFFTHCQAEPMDGLWPQSESPEAQQVSETGKLLNRWTDFLNYLGDNIWQKLTTLTIM
ncbi:MAG: hypothetical protein AB4058_16055 [Microcystaceae cyanobacterium]